MSAAYHGRAAEGTKQMVTLDNPVPGWYGSGVLDITCDCSADVDEGDDGGTIAARVMVARKRWRCCECREAIEPNQKYERAFGMYGDGKPWVVRTCLPCVRIRERYCPHGWVYGELAGQIKECIGWDYREVPVGDDPRYDEHAARRLEKRDDV